MTYRAKNGKFVSKASPIAVATIISNRANAERTARIEQLMRQRRADASKHGYRGPLTRDELARLASR